METIKSVNLITKADLSAIVEALLCEIKELQSYYKQKLETLVKIKELYVGINAKIDKCFPTKVCAGCDETQHIDMFSKSGKDKYGKARLRPRCKTCESSHRKTLPSYSIEKRKEAHEKWADWKKEYYKLNKDWIAEWQAENYRVNKDSINAEHKRYREQNPEKEKIRHAKWYNENKAWIYQRKKAFYNSNPGKKWALNCRRRVSLIFKSGKEYPELIGCDAEFLQNWLMFCLSICDDEKMTQENYGSYWHIDHTIPCAAFDMTDEEHKSQCFHWTNLSPLEKIENVTKGGKVIQKYIDTQNDRLKMFGILNNEVYPYIAFQARPTIAGSI